MSDMKVVQIPVHAMKDLKCACGSDFFDEKFSVKYYPGGLYSAMPQVAKMARYFCAQCGAECTPVFKDPGKDAGKDQGTPNLKIG